MTFHTPMAPPRLVASGGPVSRALAVMAGADPDLARIRTLRRQIALRIEADIALLDALSGDPDLEDDADAEPSLGSLGGTGASIGLHLFSYRLDRHPNAFETWAASGTDDREDENEHATDDAEAFA